MIRIITIGKLKDNYMKELCLDYLNRISKYHKIEIIEIKDNDDIKKETKELLNHFHNNEYNVALCIDGKEYDSISFSKHLNSLFNYNSTVTFIIGSSNGLGKEILEKCNERLSFSKLTFPHGLFRGMLLEQIYRSFKIINNESYHK